MSTWTNEIDVLRDLDRLSGLKQSNTYPASNAFGRGKLIVKEDRHGRRMKVAEFSPPPKIPVAQSDPEVEVSSIQGDAAWERDKDLYLQLRQVCGRGHSNELIEKEFGQSEWHSQEQLNGASCDPIAENLLPQGSNNSSTILDPEDTTFMLTDSAFPPLQTLNSELVLPDTKDSQARQSKQSSRHETPTLHSKDSHARLFVHPPKLKPSRNALLNGLARKKILQLSEESKMTGPAITCHEREAGCIAEDVSSNDTGHKLAISTVDLQKTEIESVGICDRTQSYGESQKQCINWSDIRKLKASRYSPASVYSDGSPGSSPVHMVNSHTSKISRQDSKVKSTAATNVSEFLVFSASQDFSSEERDASEWKQNDCKKQNFSQHKSKRTKEDRCSLPSSPINSMTPDEKLSWFSLRQHNSHPKNIMLSDYIDTVCSLGSVPTQNVSEVSIPLKEESRNCHELQIDSERDFPPL